MLEKLAWCILGGLLLAGGMLSACSQETAPPVEVGSVQVELRSDLVLTEAQDSEADAIDPQELDRIDSASQPIQASQRIPLTAEAKARPGSEYDSLHRYEFLPALLDKPDAGKSTSDDKDTGAASMASLKYRVLAGKGFGIGTLEKSETVHPDDAHYYYPTVALRPTFKASEHLEPVGELFKSQKPMIFHANATGFAPAPEEESASPGRSFTSETRLMLAPIPETQMYLSSQPKTEVSLTPAKNRLDLMNGNEHLNRHRFENLP